MCSAMVGVPHCPFPPSLPTEREGAGERARERVRDLPGRDVRPREIPGRGGLVFKANRLLYHSTVGSRVIKKKKNIPGHGHGHDQLDGLLLS